MHIDLTLRGPVFEETGRVVPQTCICGHDYERHLKLAAPIGIDPIDGDPYRRPLESGVCRASLCPCGELRYSSLNGAGMHYCGGERIQEFEYEPPTCNLCGQ